MIAGLCPLSTHVGRAAGQVLGPGWQANAPRWRNYLGGSTLHLSDWRLARRRVRNDS